MDVSDEDKKAYYKQILGEDYLELTIFNSLMQEDIKVKEYFSEDKDNMLVIIEGTPRQIFAINRQHAKSMLPLYECTNPDSMALIEDRKYMNLSSLGCPCRGVADYNAFHNLLDAMYRIVVIRLTPRKTKTMVDHDILHHDAGVVGGNHCQSGSESYYYSTYIPSSVV
jgi:hypothetical protein